MKGQTQAVTAVLITGVIVAAVTSAYIWGVPLIEKREGQADVKTLESSVLGVEDSIDAIASSGRGASGRVQLELENGGVEVNASENYIEITAVAQGADYSVGNWELLRGEERQGLSIGSSIYGIKGENTAGVVAAKRPAQANSVVKYRIEFRNLRATTPSGPELTLIDLQSSGATESRGDTTIRFSNQGTEVDTGNQGVKIGPNSYLDRTRTVVSVDLR